MNVRINVAKWLQDFRLPHRPLDGRGWLHLDCPFCPGAPDGHLGYHPATQRWNCFRCGRKTWEQVARALSGLGMAELLARYGTGEVRRLLPQKRERRETGLTRAKLPQGCGPMEERHHAYLRKRLFDPEALARTWGLLGTGLTGPDKLRVVAPVLHEGRMVTWQARDVTGKAPAKYRAAPPKAEARPIKHCLYGLDLVNQTQGCVVVEGIVDVWRLGPGAVATFGTEWTQQQASLLQRIARVWVLYDAGEEKAAEFAEALVATLLSMGVSAERLDLTEGGDPGELPQDDADHYMRELGLR